MLSEKQIAQNVKEAYEYFLRGFAKDRSSYIDELHFTGSLLGKTPAEIESDVISKRGRLNANS